MHYNIYVSRIYCDAIFLFVNINQCEDTAPWRVIYLFTEIGKSRIKMRS